MVSNEKAITEIVSELRIARQTAFNWCHRFLYSLRNIDKELFKWISESDVTCFKYSEKGTDQPERKGWGRGKPKRTEEMKNRNSSIFIS